MKALTIKQPWAWCIVADAIPDNLKKDVENRSRRLGHRGMLAIHAGKSFDDEGYDFIKREFQDIELPSKDEFQMGGIVGVVDMVDCVEQSESRWFFGPFGYVFEEAVEIELIPMTGKQGLFEVGEIKIKRKGTEQMAEEKTVEEVERGACGNKGCNFHDDNLPENCGGANSAGDPVFSDCEKWMLCIDSLPKADVVSKTARKLPVRLNDAQIAERAREAADIVHSARELEEKISALKKSYGDTIKSLRVRADELSEEIHCGEIELNVDCLIRKTFDTGLYEVIRLDNNTVIESRPLNPDELQAELDMWLGLDETGELMDMAEAFIRSTKRATASHLQRKFGLGVNQAETLIIELAQRGVLGPADDKGERAILEIEAEEPPADPEEDETFRAVFEAQVQDAIELIRKSGRVSTAMVQRGLKLGYTRVCKIMDELEDRKIIGPVKDNAPRDILIEVEVPELGNPFELVNAAASIVEALMQRREELKQLPGDYEEAIGAYKLAVLEEMEKTKGEPLNTALDLARKVEADGGAAIEVSMMLVAGLEVSEEKPKSEEE